MDEIRLTIQQAQSVFNKSRNTIYYWTNTGKVEYRDSENGRMLIFTKEQYDKFLKQHNPYYNTEYNIEQNNPIEPNLEYKNEFNTVQRKALNPEIQYIFDTYTSQMRELNTQLLEYAEQAGQVKLLTDNNKFYQDEYFRLKYENERLTNLNNELSLKVSNLEHENENIKLKLDKYESKWWNRSILNK